MKRTIAGLLAVFLVAFSVSADVQYSVDLLVEKLARDALVLAAEKVVGRIPVSMLPVKNEGALASANYVGEAVRALAKKSLGLSLVLYEVDRENIEKALKEIELAYSGIVAEGATPQLGKIEGVKYLLSGSVTEAGSDFIITLQLVDIESAKIVSSAQAAIPRSDMVKAAETAAFEYVAANGVGLGVDYSGVIALGIPGSTELAPNGAFEGRLSYRFSRNWKFSLVGFYESIVVGKDSGKLSTAKNLTMLDTLLTQMTLPVTDPTNPGTIPRRRSDGSIDYLLPAQILIFSVNMDRALSFMGASPMIGFVLPFARELSLNLGAGPILCVTNHHVDIPMRIINGGHT